MVYPHTSGSPNTAMVKPSRTTWSTRTVFGYFLSLSSASPSASQSPLILTANPHQPLVYSGNGSHANYAITGKHDHTIPDVNLPDGLIVDYTDAGTLWDPTLSAYYYSYDATSSTFTSYDTSGDTPVNWLYYNGTWGDEQYPDSDKRQKKFFGQPKYASGPTGPEDKQLNRTKVCPSDGVACILRWILGP